MDCWAQDGSTDSDTRSHVIHNSKCQFVTNRTRNQVKKLLYVFVVYSFATDRADDDSPIQFHFIALNSVKLKLFTPCMHYNTLPHFSHISMNAFFHHSTHPLPQTDSHTQPKKWSLQFLWHICYDWFRSSFEQNLLCDDCTDVILCLCGSPFLFILLHDLAFCCIFCQHGKWLLQLQDFSVKDVVTNDQHRNVLINRAKKQPQKTK